METITKSEFLEYKEAFEIFDRDHSGKLSSKEMKLVFEALGIKANSREMRRLMHKMDSDGDGEISFEEFLNLMGKRIHTNEEKERSFNFFDQDSDGFITLQELGQAFQKLGEKFSDKEITEMFNSADENNDGKINFQEFVKVVDNSQ